MEACTIDIESSTATDCGPLGLHVQLGAAEEGQENVVVPRQKQVRMVRLGGDVHREIELAHGRKGAARIGHRHRQIAAQADQHLGAAIGDGLDRIVPILLEACQAAQALETGTEISPLVATIFEPWWASSELRSLKPPP